MKGVPVILAALMLSGCGTYVWSQPSASPQTATNDNAECRAEARTRAANSVVLGFPQGLPPSRFDTAWSFEGEHRTYVDCMQRHGYTLEKLRSVQD